MTLSKSFTEFSLVELFRLIDHEKKTGSLSVCTLPDIYCLESKPEYYYIWFRQGRIIAVTNRLNGQGLIGKIKQRGWLKEQVIEEFFTRASSGMPLGLYLKIQGMLSAEQLNLLFASQLQLIRQLFEIHKGVFKLDTKAPHFLWEEMTGLSIRTIEVALMALRTLKNWEILADVLPCEDCAIQSIQSITQDKPQMRLNAFEWQVWEFADGTVTLKAIASQLNQPTALVQQAAFRLMLAGLVEEVPLLASTLELNNYPMDVNRVNIFDLVNKRSNELETLQMNTSFLQNLVGFLKSKN